MSWTEFEYRFTPTVWIMFDNDKRLSTKRMRLGIRWKGDSFSFANTCNWRKCSLVSKIIHPVEYSPPMARATKSPENAKTDWGNLLTPTVTNETLLR